MQNVFTDMKTWTDRLGRSKLRTFTDEHNRYWIEQNANKASKWAKLAREGTRLRGSSTALAGRTPAACLSTAKSTRQAKQRKSSCGTDAPCQPQWVINAEFALYAYLSSLPGLNPMRCFGGTGSGSGSLIDNFDDSCDLLALL
jgi:hypothetical protein